jgi:hypothetical protein
MNQALCRSAHVHMVVGYLRGPFAVCLAGLRVTGCVSDLAVASSRKQLVDRVSAEFGGKLNILGTD